MMKVPTLNYDDKIILYLPSCKYNFFSIHMCIPLARFLTGGPWRGSRAGVVNSFGFAGHIRDKLGIHGQVHVHLN